MSPTNGSHDLRNASEAPWLTVALAWRWPAALVLSAWALATAAIQILRAPIPIALPQDKPFPVRVVGELNIDSVKQPVRIHGERALRIEAAGPLPVSGGVAVKGDVDVANDVNVKGTVTVDEVSEPVSVHGDGGAPVLVGSSADQPVQVDVNGDIGVNQVAGKISVQLRDAAKTLLPIP